MLTEAFFYQKLIGEFYHLPDSLSCPELGTLRNHRKHISFRTLLVILLYSTFKVLIQLERVWLNFGSLWWLTGTVTPLETCGFPCETLPLTAVINLSRNYDSTWERVNCIATLVAINTSLERCGCWVPSDLLRLEFCEVAYWEVQTSVFASRVHQQTNLVKVPNAFPSCLAGQRTGYETQQKVSVIQGQKKKRKK